MMNIASMTRGFFFALLLALAMSSWADGAEFDSGPAGADGIGGMPVSRMGAYDRPGRNWDLVLHGLYGKDDAAERDTGSAKQEKPVPYWDLDEERAEDRDGE